MPDTSRLILRIFDGTRQMFSKPADFLVSITNGYTEHLLSKDYNTPQIAFDLPFYDNQGDNYQVVVYTEGYKQAGFVPVTLSKNFATTLDIMLVPDTPTYHFAAASWNVVAPRYHFFGSDTDARTAERRYENMFETEPTLACLLNLIEAMGAINLAQGTPLNYIKQVRWDKPPAQDRFFAYCDAALIDQVRAAAAKKQFAEEPNPAAFHPGSTHSWKQIQFGEANVQLTFHENDPDCKVIDGVKCVTVEPDIDYFKSLLEHGIFEVTPNALTHTLTNPVEVYLLRWMAGRHAGVPDFAPLYTLA